MDTRTITTSADLAQFCASFGDEQFITVDTEFIRERTYFPQLCLMQVATSREAVAIDPIAGPDMDLTPLYDAFADERLVKVFHAASQDIEIFVKQSGRVPYPLYDTQIAAMVCGYGESISYENLVMDLVGASLDKASRFTDWARRPLSDRQLVYALDDVIHLRVVYEKLKARIEEDGRSEWIAQEMTESADITKYRVDANRAWMRLKVKSRSPEVLQILRAAAAWREEMAAKKDVPRQRILKDDYVVQVAMQMPESVGELLEIRGIQGQLGKEMMASLVEALHTARMAPKESFPKPEEREKPMPAAQEACLDQLKLLLRQKAEDYHVVPRLVADKAELEAVVRGKLPLESAAFGHGWRYDVFGAAAKDLLAGKLTARVEPHRGGFGLVWSV
ncbi:MAG: ribonuclease D [Alphaproteobacteria bacterium]|nr:ribonuclease D [Alphaproteobacteria bacterium]